MDMKKQLQRRLVANVLMDKCAAKEHIIFKDSLCAQERVIRFTTVFARRLFPVSDITAGRWKTGDEIMYEVENGVNSCIVNCIYAPIAPPVFPKGVLKTWDISNSDTNALFDSFDWLIEKEIPHFEQVLQERINEEKPETPVLYEGALTSNILNKYERNQQARVACIAAHGTACSVCGLDFGKVYGPEFAGKIEVHHIVPLCEIGEEYVVDPINDLVPVCPNCHTALHSKPNGVYTIDELKKIRAQNHG